MKSSGRLRPVRPATITMLAFVAALAIARTGAAGPELQHVTLAKTSTGVQLILPDIALKMGYFTKHGLDVSITMVVGDPGSIPALVSGSVNIAIMTATPCLVAVAKGARIQMISPLSTYPEQIVMRKVLADRLGITAATPLVEKLRALRGRTVAVLDVGGGLMYQLRAALVSNGIDPKEVPVVAMNPYSSQLAALQRGAIDVIAPAVPYGQIAVSDGYGVMIANVWAGDVPAIRGQVFQVISAETGWAAGHADTIKAVRAALQDAMSYLHANPAAVAELAHELQPNFSVTVLNAVIGKGTGWPTTTTISRKDFDGMQGFAKLSGADTASVTYNQVVWSGP